MNAERNEHLIDGKYGIRDLVDLDELRRIFERFTEATGFTIGFLDHPGLNILIATGWRDICTKFHRGCPVSADNCSRSNRRLQGQLAVAGKLMVEPCENGLVDCAIPIIVKGKHIATLATGQLLIEKPDLERFKRQAKVFGFDEREYLRALGEVPVVSEEKLRSVTTFLGEMALILSQLGYARLTIKEEAGRLEREIAVRTQAEAALLESEARFQSLVENAPDAIFLQSEGRFVFLNLAMARLMGASNAGDLVGKSVFGGISPDHHERVRERIRLQCETEKPVPLMEMEYVRLDGSHVPVETTAMPVQWEDRQAHLVFVRDITERKTSEQSLRRVLDTLSVSAKRATAILSEAGCLLNIVSGDDLLRHAVEFVRRELGVDRCGIYLLDEATDQLRGTFGTDDRGQTTDEREARMDKNIDLWAALQERIRNNVPGWISTHGNYLYYKDRFRGVPGTGWVVATPISVEGGRLTGIMFNDCAITHAPLDESQQDQLAVFCSLLGHLLERRKAEAEREKVEVQLRQAQKMESVGRLAGGVAHDFNNMLGVILGRTEMALERLDPSHELYDDLTEIRKAAQHSADLTRKLLAFGRKQTIKPEVLDLNETVAGTLKMLQRLIGEEIELAWHPETGLWPVRVDPSQIDQVLANLCVNARDAISGVGKMTIETGNTTFDDDYCAAHRGSSPGDYVLLTVSDNGCGMEKETQSHLFEPFYTTKEMGKGTGLGLATVYGIVKQNHGYINVYSEPGRGTAFKIYLPRHMGKAETVPPEEEPRPVQRGNETILLVEDEPATLKMTLLILQRQGYTVLAASTPGEAVRLAREHASNIDLLMTDVVMPEMNGRDLARNLLSLYPQLKRLFTSGYTANVIAHHGVLDEGVHFIQKPFRVQDLADKVRRVLDEC